MKIKHTRKFFRDKFIEIKNYCKRKGVIFPFNSMDDLEATWERMREEGIKNIDKEIKYNVRYGTNYKSALKEYQRIKELGIEDNLKFKDIKTMTTTEFAEIYEGQIMDMYKQKKSEGMSGKDAGEFLSTFWFGSDSD